MQVPCKSIHVNPLLDNYYNRLHTFYTCDANLHWVRYVLQGKGEIG